MVLKPVFQWPSTWFQTADSKRERRTDISNILSTNIPIVNILVLSESGVSHLTVKWEMLLKKHLFFFILDLYGRGGNDHERDQGSSLALECKTHLRNCLPGRKLTLSNKRSKGDSRKLLVAWPMWYVSVGFSWQSHVEFYLGFCGPLLCETDIMSKKIKSHHISFLQVLLIQGRHRFAAF